MMSKNEIMGTMFPPSDDPLLSQIGGTDTVSYPGESNISCKLEYQNPCGSMKDRVAYLMVRMAEKRGVLSGDGPVVESSSGNTGAAVAFVANRLGYDCVITCPDSTSQQKLDRIRAMGAELVLCDSDVSSDHGSHYTSVAGKIADERDGVWLNQYHNDTNPRTHYLWTGQEVVEEMSSDTTHFVGVMGTGGTLTGIGRAIDESEYDVDVIGVDAEKSNISNEFYGESPGEYDTEIEGLGKDHRLPTMWFEYVDEVESVEDSATLMRTKLEWKEHGFFIGTSAAAALEVALSIDKRDDSGEVMVLICDGGEKYTEQVL